MLLNLFPYTNGHLMVAPYEHLGRLQDLEPETIAEMMALAQRAMGRLEEIYAPHGYNVGFNQGRVAGAGFEHHIHMHVVPRWGGDTNFMPVIADTRVMPQSLEESYEALRGAFDCRAPARARRDLQGLRHPRPLRLGDGRDDRLCDRPRLRSGARDGCGTRTRPTCGSASAATCG